MNKKIFIDLPYSRVLKLELPGLISSTLAIVEKYNPTTMHIDGMYQKLKEQETNSKKLSEITASHPLSSELNDLWKKLQNNVNGFRHAAESLNGSSTFSEQSAKIIPVLNQYLKLFRKGNRNKKEQQILQFVDAIKSDAELQTVLNVVNMKTFTDEMEGIILEINQKTAVRRKTWSEKMIKDRLELRNDVIGALTNLFKAIELAKVEYTDVDYMPMINELNEMLVSYQTNIKTRFTLREQAKKTTVASSTKTTATAE